MSRRICTLRESHSTLRVLNTQSRAGRQPACVPAKTEGHLRKVSEEINMLLRKQRLRDKSRLSGKFFKILQLTVPLGRGLLWLWCQPGTGRGMELDPSLYPCEVSPGLDKALIFSACNSSGSHMLFFMV